MRLFYCYSHADSGHRKRLDEHLSLLKREGIITEWFDGNIGPGKDIDSAIDENLARSDIVLLLISSAFRLQITAMTRKWGGHWKGITWGQHE